MPRQTKYYGKMFAPSKNVGILNGAKCENFTEYENIDYSLKLKKKKKKLKKA
jgi:hypothetical protein